jgi:hypothetical protein
MMHSWSLNVYSPHQGIVIAFPTYNKVFCGVLDMEK